MDYLSVFVEIISDYLIKENITVNQFSKRIGVAERAVAKWMSTEYFPTINCAVKVADCCNCSVDYLFGLNRSPFICVGEKSASFNNRFNELLSKRKITPYRVAKDCKIGESAISKWKKGVYPKTETLISLAVYFSCSIDYLIGRTNKIL
jgi:transcriptional regulator with XRE-family HTH domain